MHTHDGHVRLFTPVAIAPCHLTELQAVGVLRCGTRNIAIEGSAPRKVLTNAQTDETVRQRSIIDTLSTFSGRKFGTRGGRRTSGRSRNWAKESRRRRRMANIGEDALTHAPTGKSAAEGGREVLVGR